MLELKKGKEKGKKVPYLLMSDQSKDKQQLCLREISKKPISYRNIKQTKPSTTMLKTKVLGFGGGGWGGWGVEVFNYFVS